MLRDPWLVPGNAAAARNDDEQRRRMSTLLFLFLLFMWFGSEEPPRDTSRGAPGASGSAPRDLTPDGFRKVTEPPPARWFGIEVEKLPAAVNRHVIIPGAAFSDKSHSTPPGRAGTENLDGISNDIKDPPAQPQNATEFSETQHEVVRVRLFAPERSD